VRSPRYVLIFTSVFLYIYIFFLFFFPLFPLSFLFLFSLPFRSFTFFIFLSLGRGWCRRGARSAKIEVKLRFYLDWSNLFVRNEGRLVKIKVKIYLCWSIPFVRNQDRLAKIEVNFEFTCPRVTLVYEIKR